MRRSENRSSGPGRMAIPLVSALACCALVALPMAAAGGDGTSDRDASATRSSSSSSSSGSRSSSSSSRGVAVRSSGSSSSSSRSSTSSSSSRSKATRGTSQRDLRSRWRDHRRPSSGGHHSGYYGHYPYYWYYPYGSSRYSWYWPRHYGFYWGGPWGWGVTYRDGYYQRRSVDEQYRDPRRDGAMDFDVSPEEAEIWINGEFVGIADDFDGFPTYLWLPAGNYEVEIYAPGYETMTHEVRLQPGEVVDFDSSMRRGHSERPVAARPVPSSSRATQPWDGDDRAPTWERPPEAAMEPWSEPQDEEARSAVLQLDVRPDDAAVYLDGEYLGPASELRSGQRLELDPGEHSVSVVRPGFGEKRRSFTIEAGEELVLEMELVGEI